MILSSPKTISFAGDWAALELPARVVEILSAAPALYVPESREDLLNWSLGRETGTTDWRHSNRDDKGVFEVGFDVPGIGRVVEGRVTKARNGIAVNFPDVRMRRRDPN